MASKYFFFFHLTSPFSNFHPAKFVYKHWTFVSNEQFMMFGKAKAFKDEKTAGKILELHQKGLMNRFLVGEVSREQILKDKDLSAEWNRSMMQVKKLGRDVQGYDEKVWSGMRSKVVLVGAKLKFGQNQRLQELLLETGDCRMVEASPYDKIWGIGLSEKDATKVPAEKWPGLNLLGHVLDQVKDFLRLEMQKKMTGSTEAYGQAKLVNKP